MRIKDGFQMHEVCGEHVVVATGEECMDFNKMISLNGSAALLWKAVEGRSFNLQDMVDVLRASYDIDEATAKRDSRDLLDKWASAGLLEE